jgi:hypothetical protein
MPTGLGPAGTALWKRLVSVYDFEPRELVIVELACRQASDIAALDRAIKADGVIVLGSKGQPRLAQAVVEVRQCRLALARLLGELALQAEDAKPSTARSERAQRAANSRWTRVRAVRERQEERFGETA